MPRKFLDADKRKWLELYDSGKSEKWIAKQHAKCDARTVKRGIEEARRIQDAKIAEQSSSRTLCVTTSPSS